MRDLVAPALSAAWTALILCLAWQAWTAPEAAGADLDRLSRALAALGG